MDGKLKVQFTEPQQVTPFNFEEMMQSLLGWSMPIINGETTSVVTMPTIPEENEEEQEKEQGKNEEIPEEKTEKRTRGRTRRKNKRKNKNKKQKDKSEEKQKKEDETNMIQIAIHPPNHVQASEDHVQLASDECRVHLFMNKAKHRMYLYESCTVEGTRTRQFSQHSCIRHVCSKSSQIVPR